METKDLRTDFLFPKRSFFTGLASVFSLDGTAEFNTSRSALEADTKAIKRDWEMVGEDFRRALNEPING